jgi:hypothetical protein
MHVGFRVGLSSQPNDALTDAELRRLEWNEIAPPATAQVGEGLRWAAEDASHTLETLGDRALAGEETIFAEASELRREHTRKYTGESPEGRPEKQGNES